MKKYWQINLGFVGHLSTKEDNDRPLTYSKVYNRSCVPKNEMACVTAQAQRYAVDAQAENITNMAKKMLGIIIQKSTKC